MDPLSDAAITANFLEYLISTGMTVEEAEASAAATEHAIQEAARDAAQVPRYWDGPDFNFKDVLPFVKRVHRLAQVTMTAYTTKLIGQRAVRAFNSARKAPAAIMKSWRKRAADFGQWERRVKRRVFRSLGKKYRTNNKKVPLGKRKLTGYAMNRGVRFRRGRRPRMQTKSSCRVYDDSFTVASTGGCSWVGLHGNGGMERMYESVADSMVRALFHASGGQIQSSEQTLVSDAYLPACDTTDTINLVIDMEGLQPGDGDVATGTSTHLGPYNITGKSLTTLGDEIGTDLKAKSQQGLYPYRMTLTNVNKVFLIKEIDLSQSTLSFYCKRVVDIQNQTAAHTGATTDANDIHAVTLQGKIYRFNHDVAEMHERVATESTIFEKFRDADEPDGIVTAAATLTDHHLVRHPPAPRALFRNCVSVSNVRLGPGQSKHFIATLKFSGKIRTFFQKQLHRSGTSVTESATSRSWGKYTLVGVEPQIRTSTLTDIACNVESHVYTFLKIKPVHNTIKAYIS